MRSATNSSSLISASSEEQQHQAFDLLAQRGIAQVVDVEDQPCRFPFDLEARGETAGENVLETHELRSASSRSRADSSR